MTSLNSLLKINSMLYLSGEIYLSHLKASKRSSKRVRSEVVRLELTCVEHEPCEQNERHEEVRDEEYCIHVVLGQVSDEDPDKSGNRSSEQDSPCEVPESVSRVVEVVIFEYLVKG